MLSPEDREQLLDALRPPQGFTLSRALCTTYSLDLLALLTAPLAFTFFDAEDREGGPSRDPVALLHAVRMHAERIHIFCQQGRISVPGQHQALFQQLERSIVEVRAPGERGVFHPKVWVLRFAAADGEVCYRLLVASRNLTFDSSWDVLLTLDGVPRPGRHFRDNGPLTEFVARLPGLSARTPPPELRRVVAQVVRELRTVEFERPPGCEKLRFHALGLRASADWPFPTRSDQSLLISPFINTGFLGRLFRTTERVTVVSREEELAKLPPRALENVSSRLVLRPELYVNELENEDTDPTRDASTAGLHAKVFSFELGASASLFVGSANATTAALERNVEFMVELRGARRDFGPDAILGDTQHGLRSLLQEFAADEQVRPDEDMVKAEGELQTLCEAIARLDLVALLQPDGELFEVKLECQPGDLAGGRSNADVWCRPVSLPAEGNLRLFVLGERCPVEFRLTEAALTAFFVFEVRVRVGKATATRAFVLNLPLVGEPQDRAAGVLRRLLESRERVLALLLMMLSGEQFSADGLSSRLAHGNGSAEALGFDGEVTLFEALVRTLDRDPTRLDRLERTVAELRATEAGQTLLPAGFDEVWGPIWTARRELET